MKNRQHRPSNTSAPFTSACAAAPAAGHRTRSSGARQTRDRSADITAAPERALNTVSPAVFPPSSTGRSRPRRPIHPKTTIPGQTFFARAQTEGGTRGFGVDTPQVWAIDPKTEAGADADARKKPRNHEDIRGNCLAEPVGFEPTVGSHPHNFSRVAPSAARTRFRGQS